MFDATINLGTILQAIVMLVAFNRQSGDTRERLARIEVRLDHLEAGPVAGARE